MVFEHEADYEAQEAAIRAIADMVGCSSETLQKWVRQFETDEGRRRGDRRGA